LERLLGSGPEQMELCVAVGLLGVHTEPIAPARLESQRLAPHRAGGREFAVVRGIPRAKDQTIVEEELEPHGADQAEPIRPAVRPPRRGTYRTGLIGSMRYQLFIEDSLVFCTVYPKPDGRLPDPRPCRSGPPRLGAGRSRPW